ncbi:hypothetical protein [Christiangramia salexigens]|uniref:Outer membrane protein beta-barrel domain-containing protein n=1 Tax=Christiangramia salexigens TaxID=1913577 RepID=A0A1L3J2I0_9FLAO|nr:hypothetical protein [Christiangramia salexigens]APG59318.1 hypothetical protein LPB144_02325 [Christiangramia salexigens]
MKNLFVAFIVLITGFSVNSQELPKRIGVKTGFPNGMGVNFEYVTNLLEGKLAPNAEFSVIPVKHWMAKSLSDRDGTIYYYQAGMNYYILEPGKGFYGNLSYGYLKGDGVAYNVRAENRNALGQYPVGTGYFKESNHSINLKAGNKIGNKYYFRPEVGYAFNNLPKEYAVDVRFQDETSEVQYESIPGVFTKGILFNIGAGIAF